MTKQGFPKKSKKFSVENWPIFFHHFLLANNTAHVPIRFLPGRIARKKTRFRDNHSIP
jgi:hypothetical protein